MGSRILNAAEANSKVTICCTFMVLAAVGAYACPYASAAGVQTFGEYSGDGGILQSNEYTSIQSTEDIGFTNPGQETLTGVIADGLITVGRSGTRYNATIDANDHQIYKGDKSLQYLDGGTVRISKDPDNRWMKYPSNKRSLYTTLHQDKL